MKKRTGLIATKIGNSSYYDEKGKSLPVTILKINHVKGVTIIEWSRTIIEAVEANAANTLMCPTLPIKEGIVPAPIKYPIKYPESMKPVAAILNSSCTALTPSKDPCKPCANMINAIPVKRAQEFLSILFIISRYLFAIYF